MIFSEWFSKIWPSTQIGKQKTQVISRPGRDLKSSVSMFQCTKKICVFFWRPNRLVPFLFNTECTDKFWCCWNHWNLCWLFVHVQGVVKLLKNLNPHKAMDLDNLPSRLLKEVADEIAPSLMLLFQATLTQGCIPSVWKEGLIITVFKKGNKSIALNYRPISLTSICCKLQEHIIHSNIMDHLDKQKILSDDQAYRKCSVCLGPSKVMGTIFCHMCMKHTSQVHSVKSLWAGFRPGGILMLFEPFFV